MTRDRLEVLSVCVDRVDMEETLRCVECFIAERKPNRIVTVNLEYLRHARACPGFKEALDAADLAVADGMPLLWASRLLRRPLKERIAGVDLADRCAALSAAKGYRIFFLGAGPGVANDAARILRERYSGLNVAGVYAPPIGEFSEEEEERICRLLAATRPDILLVALPTPRQELWNHANAERWNVPVVIGVGAAFDMLSGRTRRAPNWMQRSGLEWAFRLSQEPGRLWKRYLVHDAAVMLRILVNSIAP